MFPKSPKFFHKTIEFSHMSQRNATAAADHPPPPPPIVQLTFLCCKIDMWILIILVEQLIYTGISNFCLEVARSCPQLDIYWTDLTLGPGWGVLPYSLGGGVPLGSRKSYPLPDQILWPYTGLKMLNCSWFQSFVSDPVKRDPILDQFSMITRPYTRPNGLKTIPSPAAYTRCQYMGVPPPPPSLDTNISTTKKL